MIKDADNESRDICELKRAVRVFCQAFQDARRRERLSQKAY